VTEPTGDGRPRAGSEPSGEGHAPDAGDVPLPLAGVTVVDASSLLAAPLTSMFLGDYGAEVVKVERPGTGDELRFWGHDRAGVGLYSKVVNRNKRSVTADLRTSLGRAILLRLVRDADVLVENFRPGTLERWGLGYTVLAEANPRLVVLRVTGFGQTGPYRDRPGFGTLAEAFAGFAFVNGFPDRPPLLPGFGLADSTTGLAGAFAVLVALRARELTGRGQEIDLAIYEPLFTLLGPQVIDHDQLGLVQERGGSRLPFTAPRNTFETNDGHWVTLAGSTQSIFRRLCRAVARPELADDPRFADNRLRLQHVEPLEHALREAIGRLTLDDLLARAEREQAAVVPVYDVAGIFADPHYEARQNIVGVEDEELGGTVRMQNVVAKLSATPGRVRAAGPRLGEHNREILVDRLGFSEQELRDAGLPIDDAPGGAEPGSVEAAAALADEAL
jgi:crotonobetainyl-CoA:carnitine CoA-transferase CaiB-like acyl-CoA transferase